MKSASLSLPPSFTWMLFGKLLFSFFESVCKFPRNPGWVTIFQHSVNVIIVLGCLVWLGYIILAFC